MKTLSRILLFCLSLALSAEALTAETNVGMEGVVNVTIPGSPVTAKLQQGDNNLRVSISQSDPANHQYTIHYSAELPGDYDLAKSLSRISDSSAPIQAIPVTVTSLLPAVHSGKLIPAQKQPYPFFTAYRALMISAVVLWLLCLIPLFLWGRKPKVKTVEEPQQAPLTLEEILQPLMQEAALNQLDDAGKAKLEKAAILQLQQLLPSPDSSGASSPPEKRTPYEMIQALRQNTMTSDAIQILEQWLHRPTASQAESTLPAEQHRKLQESLAQPSSTPSHPHSDLT